MTHPSKTFGHATGQGFADSAKTTTDRTGYGEPLLASELSEAWENGESNIATVRRSHCLYPYSCPEEELLNRGVERDGAGSYARTELE